MAFGLNKKIEGVVKTEANRACALLKGPGTSARLPSCPARVQAYDRQVFCLVKRNQKSRCLYGISIFVGSQLIKNNHKTWFYSSLCDLCKHVVVSGKLGGFQEKRAVGGELGILGLNVGPSEWQEGGSPARSGRRQGAEAHGPAYSCSLSAGSGSICFPLLMFP